LIQYLTNSERDRFLEDAIASSLSLSISESITRIAFWRFSAFFHLPLDIFLNFIYDLRITNLQGRRQIGLNMKNSTTTVTQLSKRIAQLNSLISKFPRVRSLIRKWAFELTVLEGRLEALKAVAVVETPKQLTIWDMPQKIDWFFPPLVGSEKQIQWADKLRRDFAEYYSSLGGEPGGGEIKIKKAVGIAVSAKFWIENRDFCEKISWENMTKVLRELAALVNECQPWYSDSDQSEFKQILKDKKSILRLLRIDKAGIVACCNQQSQNRRFNG
jgi:hypothetical protein